MSTPEQPLTRKQLRELQRTGAMPVPEPSAPESKPEPDSTPEPAPAPTPARAAEPVAVPPAPERDSDVDLSATPLTRRQARQQERLRTASIPVIAPEQEQASEQTTKNESPASDDDAVPGLAEDAVAAEHLEEELVEDSAADPIRALDTTAPEADSRASDDVPAFVFPSTDSDADVAGTDAEDVPASSSADAAEIPADDDVPFAELGVDEAGAADPGPSQKPVAVGSQFGASVLEADEAAPVKMPPSFDDLIARNTSATSALSAPSALILSQTPAAPPLGGPVTATGEVILTGSYQLPERLSSSGHDPRTTDGKEADAVLLDRELPASSSPLPIAASAAISTVRGNDEIIRPPAPEKSNRWIFTLAITAGALAIAVVGLVIVAVMNGAF